MSAENVPQQDEQATNDQPPTMMKKASVGIQSNTIFERQRTFKTQRNSLRPKLKIDGDDNLMKRILGVERGTKITDFLYKRSTLTFSVLLMVILSMLGVFDDSVTLVLYLKCILMTICIFIFSSYIFTANAEVLPFVVYSFEFYIKTAYGILYSISIIYWQSNCKDCNENLIKNIIFSIELEIIIIWLCCLDGYPLKKRTKSIVLIFGALYFTYESILSSYFQNNDDYTHITRITGSFSIDWQDVYENCLQVLAIFWWKAIFTTLYSDKTTAMMIAMEPTLKWVDVERRMNSVHINNYNKNDEENNNIDTGDGEVDEMDLIDQKTQIVQLESHTTTDIEQE